MTPKSSPLFIIGYPIVASSVHMPSAAQLLHKVSPRDSQINLGVLSLKTFSNILLEGILFPISSLYCPLAATLL